MEFNYSCYGRCGREFESLEQMVALAGEGNRSPRHFCEECAPSARKGCGGW